MSKARALEGSAGSLDEPNAPKKRGRPKSRWNIRVVRIDAQKYEAHRDRGHPFAFMAPDTRTQEIDAFCARLLARSRKLESVKVDPPAPVVER